jgi:spore maturation protein CgeB
MKTKVLLIGPDCFGYNQSIASAFDDNRFEVKIIDYSVQFGQISLTNKISYFFSAHRILTTVKLLTKLNKHIISVYNQYCPDIVLIIKGDTLFEETVLKMKRSKNILWMLDGIFYNPQSMKLVDKVDAVFLFEKSEEESIKKINQNTFYLPSAFDDQIFKKLGLRKDIDLLFIGTLHDSRVKLLEKLHKAFPQLMMKVFCERYRFYKTPVKYLKSLKDPIFINRFVTPAEANILYNRSKICLNMHHEQSVYGINPRFFEITGANALQVVDYKPFFDEYFSGYPIRTYKTDAELFELISQYFSKNEQQDDHGLYDMVNKYHTYRNRVEFILDKI